MSLLTSLKSFDAYPKLHEDMKVKTMGGAIVSIVALFFIIILFISELSIYLSVETIDHLYVDTSRGEKLRINFDVVFPHIPCSLLSVDAMDVSGSHQLDVSHNIKKKPLDQYGNPIGHEVKHELGHTLTEAEIKKQKEEAAKNNGTTSELQATVDKTKQPGYCGPCYGAEEKPGQCCNTCDEVREAYRQKGWALASLNHIEQCVASGQTQDALTAELDRKEGCQMYGFIEVNKVAGNFHFAPGKSFQHAHMHIHDLAAFSAAKFNVSHKIIQLSFGESFPGIINPLDDTSKALDDAGSSGGMFMYYAKVVPTSYSRLSGPTIQTNQFSVTEHFRPVSSREGQGLPGVFFFYELSPIMVRFVEQRRSFFHFLTQLCAILGGVFTVAGMVDRIVYTSLKHFEKKMQIGKLS